jgi:hypothetical protein
MHDKEYKQRDDKRFSKIEGIHTCNAKIVIVWKIGKKWNFKCQKCREPLVLSQLLKVREEDEPTESE